MSTVQVFERNGYAVLWDKSTNAYFVVGETTVTANVTRDGYRRSYGPDKAKAITACKRKGGKAVNPFDSKPALCQLNEGVKEGEAVATNSDYRKQGYRAAKIGLRIQENPYYSTSKAGEQWAKGFNIWARYGQKTDYPKIELWIPGEGKVHCTTWAANLTIARDKYAAARGVPVESVRAEYVRR